MFERFTDRARRVIVLAQEEARDLGHDLIRPEHLALGLLEGDGVAARALAELDVTRDAVLERFLAQVPVGVGHGQKLPFTPSAKKTLELSLREALQLKHSYIGTEHILLGLIRLDDSPAAELFAVDVSTLRARVIDDATGEPKDQRTRTPALHLALGRAQGLAAESAMSSAHVVYAILMDDDAHATKALRGLGITDEAYAKAVHAIDAAETSDALHPPGSIEIRFGGRNEVMHDPELAAALDALSPEQLRTALRRAAGKDPA
ncbi:MAG TPA: Clp protease N-terminal domain-containing protein [Acidimicrobiales bacterium]|jgi:ATP-dependent Clp protease ATP-binding subunit ClpC